MPLEPLLAQYEDLPLWGRENYDRLDELAEWVMDNTTSYDLRQFAKERLILWWTNDETSQLMFEDEYKEYRDEADGRSQLKLI